MFRHPDSLRNASYAALFIGIAYLAAAFAVPTAARDVAPFTLADPRKQLEEVAQLFFLAVLVGVLLFAQGFAGIVAVAALAARAPRKDSALLGGAFAGIAFVAQALRGVWSAGVETSAGIQFASAPSNEYREAAVLFLYHNLQYQHFFSWSYIFFAGVGFAFLGWAVWPAAPRLGPALVVAAGTYAVYFPVMMWLYYSTRVAGRPHPALLLVTEVAVWLFPGLAFLLAFFWLRRLALETPPPGSP